MPEVEIGSRYRVIETVLGLQPGTVLEAAAFHGGRVVFRTRSGAAAVKNPAGKPRYLPITFSPSEMQRVLEPLEGGD